MNILSLLYIGVATILTAGALHSTTFIGPGETFQLGKNAHGSFKVSVTNEGKQNIDITEAPITGGSHSPVTLKPGEHARIDVDPNAALLFKNASEDTAVVKLKVVGDLGLNMEYQH